MSYLKKILTQWLITPVILVVMLAGCNDEESNVTVVEGQDVATSTLTQSAQTIELTKSITTSIASTGSLVITAEVFDALDLPVPNGTLVTFSADLEGVSITEKAITNSGIATASFSANNVAGIAIITAIVGDLVVTTSIVIDPSIPGSITMSSISESAIGVVNSGYPETTIVSFLVTDKFGNTVSDGTNVLFSIFPNIDGGVSLSSTSASTLNGEVRVIASTGKHAGQMGVTATVQGTSLATTATVAIWGGKGVANNFNIYYEYIDIPSAECTSVFTAVLGDIFGNPASPVTPINFHVETGTITGTSIDVPESNVSSSGVAHATYTPLLLDPGDVSTGPTGLGKKGWITMLATAPGQEPFIDINENGLYDAGDIFDLAKHDYSEPFLDADDSGTYDSGEKYFDTNGDGSYSGPNGVHDAETTIWISRALAVPTAHPGLSDEFTVDILRTSYTPPAASYLVTVVDANNNPPSCGPVTHSAIVVADGANDGRVTGTIANPVPYGVFYELADPAKPNVPVYLPVYTNSTVTGKTGGILEITIESPHTKISKGGL